jgi:ATP-binding cassette subfamily F protein 1
MSKKSKANKKHHENEDDNDFVNDIIKSLSNDKSKDDIKAEIRKESGKNKKEKVTKPEKHEPVIKPEKQEQITKPEKQEPITKPEKHEPLIKPEKQEQIIKPEKHEPVTKIEKPELEPTLIVEKANKFQINKKLDENNPYNFNYEKKTITLDSISIRNFSLSVGGKDLFEDTDLQLGYGQRYGFIGKNGSGKTSLIKQIPSLCNDNILVLYIEQELILDESRVDTPLEYVLGSNDKLSLMQQNVEKLRIMFDNDEIDHEKLAEAESELLSYNTDLEKVKVIQILNGLGFDDKMIKQPVNIFSGGWRMRISLARALYLEPDILLLDEPTNHLDLEAIIWFETYIKSWKKILIVVSHNIGFLNEVCTHIINIENKKLCTYKGNYSRFKLTYNKKLENQIKEYEKYEKTVKQMKKSGKYSKKDMDEYEKKHVPYRPEMYNNFSINFLEPLAVRNSSSNYIRFENVSFGYSDKNKILDKVSFGLDSESRICLVGLNGSGKSTLIKLISGEIQPTEGEIIIKEGIKFGYYNQHFEQQLPFDKTPVEFLQDYIPDMQEVRKYLGTIKLEGTAHNKKIGELSGGQKARVAMVKLIIERPHFLLFDEPTNHLDIETVEVLIESLESFKGGILLITHESELINSLDTQLWYMNKHTKKIDYNIESFDKYCEMILEK